MTAVYCSICDNRQHSSRHPIQVGLALICRVCAPRCVQELSGLSAAEPPVKSSPEIAELRERCIAFAVSRADVTTQPELIVRTARAFADFIAGAGPEPTKPPTGQS